MALLFWVTLVASCWGGEASHQWTCRQCILLRWTPTSLLNACCVAGLWDSASLPCNLFPVTTHVLELGREQRICLLPLLSSSLHPWPEHPCRRRQRGRDNKRKGWWSVSGKERNAEEQLLLYLLFLFSSFSRTYHRSLDTINKLWYLRVTEQLRLEGISLERDSLGPYRSSLG